MNKQADTLWNQSQPSIRVLIYILTKLRMQNVVRFRPPIVCVIFHNESIHRTTTMYRFRTYNDTIAPEGYPMCHFKSLVRAVRERLFYGRGRKQCLSLPVCVCVWVWKGYSRLYASITRSDPKKLGCSPFSLSAPEPNNFFLFRGLLAFFAAGYNSLPGLLTPVPASSAMGYHEPRRRPLESAMWYPGFSDGRS